MKINLNNYIGKRVQCKNGMTGTLSVHEGALDASYPFRVTFDNGDYISITSNGNFWMTGNDSQYDLEFIPVLKVPTNEEVLTEEIQEGTIFIKKDPYSGYELYFVEKIEDEGLIVVVKQHATFEEFKLLKKFSHDVKVLLET